jgi:TATA-box binding protein (TBP) (component of TFIID and TFIIIB)
MNYKVFISHSNAERDWELIQNLETWLYYMEIEPLLARRIYKPELVSLKIQSMINQADVMIALWTENSAKSGFVNQEIGYARDKIPIIVLKVSDASLTGLVYGIDTIDIGGENAKEELEKLRIWLLANKFEKETEEKARQRNATISAIVSGIVVFAITLGLGLLLIGSSRK